MSSEENKNNKTPAADNSAANDGQNLVDIDTIKIKLLFLCKNKKNYESAASYLIRRGWETLILGSVKEAFSMISTFKPDFVVVSVNLPTAKIQQLPTVIYNTFRCPVVTFGEESDTKTMGLLQSTAANYKMPGAVSGPSAHRRMKQILQEIYRPDIAAAKSHTEHNKNLNELPPRNQQTRSTVTYFDNTDPSQEISENKTQKKGPMIFTSEKKETGPGYYIAKGEQPKEYGQGTKNKSEKTEVSVPAFGEADINKLAELFSEATTPNTQKEKIDAGDVNTGVKIIRAESPMAAPSISNKITQSNDEKEKQEQDKISESAKFDSPEFKQAIVNMADQCVVESNANSTTGPVVYSMTAWAAEINGATGYLVTQYCGPKVEHTQFNMQLINKTKEYYEKIGATCFIYDEITLPISEEAFGNKTEDVLFSESFASGSGQATVKFIKETQEKPKLEFVRSMNKYKINPEELVENVNAGANLYLHLPKNEKFYLYLNENAALSAKQKQKLIDTATALYIEADEVKKYERTFARNRAIEKLLKPKSRKVA